MAPPMVNPAAFAAFGRLSPSSQAAWCGSPQAICTRLTPSLSMNPFSSGTDFTCNDQLQTPISRGFVAMVSLRNVDCQWSIADCEGTAALLRNRQSSRRFDPAGQGAEVCFVAFLVEGPQLVELQLRHFLRAGPHNGLASFVGGEHQLDGLGLVVAEHLPQDQDHEQ